jgi:nitric oxide dioxygenase
MPLTDREIELIRQSYARLTDARRGRDPFGHDFYERLFARLPEARQLFREDLAEQGMRFLSTLGVVVSALDRAEELGPVLGRLAEGHAAYGVKAGYYGPMWEALAETMRTELGERFDAETESAWAGAYEAVAGPMKAGGPG